MKIFVAGSWHRKRIKKLEKDIEIVGGLIAENIKCLKKILKDTGKNKKVLYVKSVNEIKKFIA